jgi:hypothetical protein
VLTPLRWQSWWSELSLNSFYQGFLIVKLSLEVLRLQVAGHNLGLTHIGESTKYLFGSQNLLLLPPTQQLALIYALVFVYCYTLKVCSHNLERTESQ